MWVELSRQNSVLFLSCREDWNGNPTPLSFPQYKALLTAAASHTAAALDQAMDEELTFFLQGLFWGVKWELSDMWGGGATCETSSVWIAF